MQQIRILYKTHGQSYKTLWDALYITFEHFDS
jgi:hypothetical protein